MYVDPKGYWRIKWNLFDFSILVLTFVEAIMSQVFHSSSVILRIGRTLRIVCIFRIVNHVRGLQILALALVKTFTEWVAPALLLLLIIMYIFAVIGDHYFHTEEVWWGTIGRCLLSLISYFTVCMFSH